MDADVNYTIEDGIPLPTTLHFTRGKSPLRAALESLEVGQSIFVTEVDRETLTNNVKRVQRAQDKWFVTRKVEGGYRVWRTADGGIASRRNVTTNPATLLAAGVEL